MHQDFLSKLKFLSGKRDITPWLTSLGLSSGLAGKILKGQKPGGDLLRALMRTERVSIRWLENNRGEPYMVTKVTDDDEAIEEITKLLDDENWSVLIATHNDERFAMILHLECRHQYKEKMVDYRDVEVICGDVTLKTVKWLLREDRAIWMLPLTFEQFDRLENGRMGNMEIWGWEDARKQDEGLPKRLLDSIKSTLHDSPYMKFHTPPDDAVATDLPPADNVHTLYKMEIISDEVAEEKLVSHFRHLDQDKRKAVLTILETMDPFDK